MESTKWQNQDTTKLFEAVLKLKTVSECESFFRDLMTLAELKEMSMRFKVARMLDKGNKSYLVIAKEAKITTATISRIAHWFKHGMGGYKLVIDRLKN
jgi:TrpR-related protein YerC/YecD